MDKICLQQGWLHNQLFQQLLELLGKIISELNPEEVIIVIVVETLPRYIQTSLANDYWTDNTNKIINTNFWSHMSILILTGWIQLCWWHLDNLLIMI